MRIVAGKERILPQGGIGPLTALATSVKYSNEPYFMGEYLPANKLSTIRSLRSTLAIGPNCSAKREVRTARLDPICQLTQTPTGKPKLFQFRSMESRRKAETTGSRHGYWSRVIKTAKSTFKI